MPLVERVGVRAGGGEQERVLQTTNINFKKGKKRTEEMWWRERARQSERASRWWGERGRLRWRVIRAGLCATVRLDL